MSLSARVLADVVVVVHAAFVAFVVLGQVLILLGGLRGWSWVRNRWFRFVHLACIGLVVAESWCGVPCPLTVWERSLRRTAGQAGYRGDFIAHWVHELLFFQSPPWVFTTAYTLFGALVAGSLWLFPPRRPLRLESTRPAKSDKE